MRGGSYIAALLAGSSAVCARFPSSQDVRCVTSESGVSVGVLCDQKNKPSHFTLMSRLFIAKSLRDSGFVTLVR